MKIWGQCQTWIDPNRIFSSLKIEIKYGFEGLKRGTTLHIETSSNSKWILMKNQKIF
jgi:hypothetical protein